MPTIDQAISLLQRAQCRDGSFESVVSYDKDFANTRKEHTIFFTSAILCALEVAARNFDDQRIQHIREKGATFLLDQRRPGWTFNYLNKSNGASPYPDDFDDTCLAVAAIHSVYPDLITGDVLASLVKLLIPREDSIGGPYRTWIVSSTADIIWQDVDPAVNANIAYLLARFDVRPKGLHDYLAHIIERKDFFSRYYAEPYFSTAYFLSRSNTPTAGSLIDFLQRQVMVGMRGASSLDMLLAPAALLHLGDRSSITKDFFDTIARSPIEVFITPCRFSIEHVDSDKKIRYSGASSLQMALLLECSALAKEIFEKKNFVSENHNDRNKLFAAGMQIVHDRFGIFSSGVKESASIILDRIEKESAVRNACLLHTAYKADEDISIRLSAAAIYGTAAYRIYDDFLDGEGDPHLLPIANICLRELTKLYDEMNADAKALFHNLLDTMEEANSWETWHCRIEANAEGFSFKQIPDYETNTMIVNKSIGLAIAPLAECLSLQKDISERSAHWFNLFISHYIYARQLNDDAHDWQDDLRAGKINSVSAMFLGNHCSPDQFYDWSVTMPELEKIFWNKTIYPVSEKSLEQCRLAREAIENIKDEVDITILENLIDPLEKAAHESISEARRIGDFIKEYRRSQGARSADVYGTDDTAEAVSDCGTSGL